MEDGPSRKATAYLGWLCTLSPVGFRSEIEATTSL